MKIGSVQRVETLRCGPYLFGPVNRLSVRQAPPIIRPVSTNSKYFDMVRIAPRKRRGTGQPRFVSETVEERVCEWEGCEANALHRAPKERGKPGDYRWFCFEHACRFNASYDFFAGMPEDEIATYQNAARYGDRPTWDLRQRAEHLGGWARAAGHAARGHSPFRDPYRFFRDPDDEKTQGKTGDEPPRRSPRTMERAALETLGLDETATLNEIKAKFKELVKRHHPDANGGDRSSEERLRQVIQAYDYLRKSGFC